MVGREGQMALLRSAVARAAGGDPCLALLGGPPGVGKSRLAREALAYAGRSGFTPAAGRAHVLSRDVAYAPLIEALGPLLRALAPERLASCAAGLPQLGLLFGGLGLEAPAALADPALERARLVEGLTRLVERLAAEAPLALLVDDADVADPSTLAALRHLVTSLMDQPILLLITQRPGEPGAAGIDALVGGLRQSPWQIERLPIEPLTAGDAAEMVTGILGGAVDPRLLDRIVARCGGIPLYLEATARVLVDSGGLVERRGQLDLAGGDLPLPADVSGPLAALAAAVTPEERNLLVLLAVAGGRLEHAILLAAAGLARRDALDALDRLERRGLVRVHDGAASSEVAHGLLRDVVLAELAPLARARAHSDLVTALLASAPEDPRLAEHVLGAASFVEPAAAVDHLLAGGERARRVGAAEDAVRYLTAALELSRSSGRAGNVTETLVSLAVLWAGLGQGGQATACWQEALTEYGRRADGIGMARARRELAMLAWTNGDLAAAEGLLVDAEAALGGLEPTSEHAELRHARTMFARRRGDTAQVKDNAAALRELATRLGSHSHAAQAHLAEAIVAFSAHDYAAMSASVEQGLAEALASGEATLVARAYDQASIAAAAQGDVGALRRASAASLKVGQDIGALALQLWPRARLAVADLLGGDWDGALRGTSEVLGLTERLADDGGMRRSMVAILGTHAWVLVHRGLLTEAHRCLDQARRLAAPGLEADRNIYSVVDTAAGMLALAEDDVTAAAEATHRLADLTAGWFPLLSAALWGEVLVRSGDTAGARRLAGRFGSVGSRTTVLPAALAAWIRGLADHRDRRSATAAGALLDAASGFDELELPFYAARARLAGAGTGSDPDAVEHGGAALKAFEELGAPVQARQARELLRSLGVVPARGRRRRDTGTRLSARELEVARLVAGGLSNSEVATRLFVSPRTVTTHLNHIYSRLNLSSRTALTRYLVDSGFLNADRL